MHLKGLTTNITINMIAVLAAGMCATGFIMMVFIKNTAISNEITRGKLLADAIRSSIAKSADQYRSDANYYINNAFKTSGYAYLSIVFHPHGVKQEFGKCPKGALKIQQQTNLPDKKKELTIDFSGTTWGLFTQRKHFIHITAIASRHDTTLAEITLIQNLETVYSQLRKTAKSILAYIFFNTILLGITGAFIISRVTVKPLLRLLKRAEHFSDSNDLILFQEQAGGEFSRLSRALNTMFQRIENDRNKLRQSVKDLKNTNIELKKAQQDIIRAEKLASVGRLAPGVAHEIGNPLGIIGGYLELIKSDQSLSTENTEYLDRTESELSRIDKIIRQLLEYAGSGGKAADEIRHPLSLHDLLHDLYDMFQSHPLLAGIEIILNLSAEKDTIIGDKDHLKQIFINLMINAVDAIRATDNKNTGKIIISSALVFPSSIKHDINNDNKDTWIKITYTDNGEGIAACHLPNVFDPFFTTKDPGKGTGLGLSVCQTIIEDIGGTITAERSGTEAEGTAIHVSIPLAE